MENIPNGQNLGQFIWSHLEGETARHVISIHWRWLMVCLDDQRLGRNMTKTLTKKFGGKVCA